MALEHHFYMDTLASSHELRDTLTQAGISLEVAHNWKHLSQALSTATIVSINNNLSYSVWPDNGVMPTRSITFRDRKIYLTKPGTEEEFERQSVLGIIALLKAYPTADAYWTAYDAQWPVLLRCNGHLMLSQARTEPGQLLDAARAPIRALFDLPHTVEPLGPWKYIPVVVAACDDVQRDAQQSVRSDAD